MGAHFNIHEPTIYYLHIRFKSDLDHEELYDRLEVCPEGFRNIGLSGPWEGRLYEASFAWELPGVIPVESQGALLNFLDEVSR